MSRSSEPQAGNLLDAITARLQNGDDVDQSLLQSEAAHSDLEGVADIIQSLHVSLKPLSPSQEFADGLRAELLEGRGGVVQRMRQMPARLSVAAIVALFAGCVLFMLRRLFGSEPAQDIQEEAVVTPL